MADKMIKCKACGEEIASSAKQCPKCGAKNKKPIYKKWWFYVIILVVLVAIGSASQSGSESGSGTKSDSTAATASTVENDNTPAETATPSAEPTPEPVSYTSYNVTELFDALESNALKAERTFQDQYVELEGYLSVIDSDGAYIAVGAAEDDWDYVLDTVHCTITSDEQLDRVMELNKGDPIVVRGQITDIGEILGYTLKIDEIG